MRADRLSHQVAALTGGDAPDFVACGLGELLYLRPIAGDAWRYRPLAHDPPWLAGPTLMYRREAWQANPFPDIDVGEDTAFVRSLPANRLRTMADPSWYVALLHPGNTGPKDLLDPRWQIAELAAILALIGPDQPFYASIRSGGRGRAMPATESRKTAITVAADFLVYDGYGGMAEYLALGLARAGARVNLAPLTLDERGLSADLRALLAPLRAQRAGTGAVLVVPTTRAEPLYRTRAVHPHHVGVEPAAGRLAGATQPGSRGHRADPVRRGRVPAQRSGRADRGRSRRRRPSGVPIRGATTASRDHHAHRRHHDPAQARSGGGCRLGPGLRWGSGRAAGHQVNTVRPGRDRAGG